VSIEGELLGVVLDLFAIHEKGSIPLRLVLQAFTAAHAEDYDRPITTRYLTTILRKRLTIRVQKTMGIMAIPRSEEARIRVIAGRYGLDNMAGIMSREIGTKGDAEEVLIPTDQSNEATA
jgi:hypothetical protein